MAAAKRAEKKKIERARNKRKKHKKQCTAAPSDSKTKSNAPEVLQHRNPVLGLLAKALDRQHLRYFPDVGHGIMTAAAHDRGNVVAVMKIASVSTGATVGIVLTC